jgi:hypothetical protein
MTARRDNRQWTLSQRFVAELRHDPKKATVLGSLLAVALFLGVRMTMQGRTPRQAAGSQTGATHAETARSPGDWPPDGDALDGRSAAEVLRREYLAELDRTVRRDIFRPDPNAYGIRPRAGADEAPAAPPELTDEQLRQRLREAVIAEARGLELESTIVSASPAAIVNGRYLHIGESIDDFEVIKISPRSCVVRKRGVTILLKMR